MGYNGPSEVKRHPWFKNINWDGIAHKYEKPFFIPAISDHNFDIKSINENWREDPDILKHYSLTLN